MTIYFYVDGKGWPFNEPEFDKSTLKDGDLGIAHTNEQAHKYRENGGWSPYNYEEALKLVSEQSIPVNNFSYENI